MSQDSTVPVRAPPLPCASMLLLVYSKSTEQLLSLDKHWQLPSWELTASTTPTSAGSTQSAGWRPRQQSLSLHRLKTTKRGSPVPRGQWSLAGAQQAEQRDPRVQQPVPGGLGSVAVPSRSPGAASCSTLAPRRGASPPPAGHPSPPAEIPVCWGPERF